MPSTPPASIQPRSATADRREGLLERAAGVPWIEVDDRAASDLELLGNGGFTPLRGFMGRKDYESVVASLRLADGQPFGLPVVLPVRRDEAASIREGQELGLRFRGRIVALLLVEEKFAYDREREATLVYRTTDPAHPGVSALLRQGELLLGGPVVVLAPDIHTEFGDRRLPPARTREVFAERGWKRVVGFQTRNPVHRAHEYILRCALETVDGLLLHPLVGETRGDDIPADVRMRCYEHVLEGYFPRERTLLSVFPAAMRYAGPREAVFHAVVRRNYGCTHFIVGPDHAGVGNYYGPRDAQRIFSEFAPGELGVEALLFDHTFHCRGCGGMASDKTCAHDGTLRTAPSRTEVHETLRGGRMLPGEFTRPEVARTLLEAYHPEMRERAADGRERTTMKKGFTIWFTGLSGAGKSTITGELVKAFEKRGVGHEVLDGDVVRTHLSKGLGFSKEDRDTNIRRIGWVARTLTKHGVGVICAAISPYRALRDEIHGEIQKYGTFVEVFATCPIPVLAERDPKGLYKKALAGEIENFTGVSDPYEAPEHADVVCHTDLETIDESAGKVLARLEEMGLIPAEGKG